VRPRKPRPGGFGYHVRRYYGRCARCIRWTGTGARRVTPPRAASQETCHKQPGPKSKSRGLETSVKAAAERREASAPAAGGPCKRTVRGARRARSANGWQQPLAWRGQFSVCAFRRDAGWGARRRRDSQRATRAFTPTRRASRVDLPPPGEGQKKSPLARGRKKKKKGTHPPPRHDHARCTLWPKHGRIRP
jgi:hypothetical protein